MLALLLLPWLAVAAPVGSWDKPCERFEEDDFLTAHLSVKEDGTWRRVRTAYEEEEGCRTPWIAYEEDSRVEAEAGEALNLRFVAARYRPLTGEVAEALNLSAYCGFQDWKANVSKEVTGLTCDEFAVPAAGSLLYTRAKREGENLRLGEADARHPGETPAGRHAAYERGAYRPSK